MKNISIIIVGLLLLFSLSSCYKNFDRTITICNGILYIERFKHSDLDLAYYYLTDSINFRMYIGEFDIEHGGYYIKCQGDSIAISETYEEKIIDLSNYSLVDLRKKKEGTLCFWKFRCQ